MRGARADHGRAGEVDVVTTRERKCQARERRPAPASRWPGRMRAERGLDRPSYAVGELRRRGGEALGRAAGVPVEQEVWRVRVAAVERGLPVGPLERRSRDEDAGSLASRGSLAHEREPLDGGEALVHGRLLQLPEGSHLGGGREQPWLPPGKRPQLVGRGERAEALEESLDEVDLGLRERRIEPEAARGDVVASRRLDHEAAGRAGQVRVVEDDSPFARRQALVEHGGELAQGPAALVAVQPLVSTGDVVRGDAALARAGDPHHQHDVARSRPAAPARRPAGAERRSRAVALRGLEPELRGAGGRERGLGPAGAGNRDDRG